MAWSGFDTKALQASAEVWVGDKRADVTVAMDRVVTEGEEGVREVIRTATTPTGEARESAQRGVAGRIESSTMIDAVDSSVTDEGDTIVGRWGWADAKLYFLIQEYGADEYGVQFEGMNALGHTLERGKDQMAGELDRIAGRN
jgi:hypothetical protein